MHVYEYAHTQSHSFLSKAQLPTITRTDAIYGDECRFPPPHTSLHKCTLLEARTRHKICRHMYPYVDEYTQVPHTSEGTFAGPCIPSQEVTCCCPHMNTQVHVTLQGNPQNHNLVQFPHFTAQETG